MTEKELKEMMALLEAQGWQPQLCDTPIPLYESVHAGNPENPGNVPPDMVLMPKALLMTIPECLVKVKGDSMADEGINDGDLVRMGLGDTPRDGDIVVVAIGSECTVKAYFEDDDGTRWLVPRNKAKTYRAIRLDDTLEQVHLCGVVREVLKPLPRVSGRVLRSTVKEAREQYPEEPKVSDRRVTAVIRILSKDIKIQRHWYAVCRGMMDEKVYGEMQYDAFCNKVAKTVPSHKHLPRADEMQAMAVESFSKPVVKWDELRAPVKGKRFRAYKDLGECTIRLLGMSDAELDEL